MRDPAAIGWVPCEALTGLCPTNRLAFRRIVAPLLGGGDQGRQ